RILDLGQYADDQGICALRPGKSAKRLSYCIGCPLIQPRTVPSELDAQRDVMADGAVCDPYTCLRYNDHLITWLFAGEYPLRLDDDLDAEIIQESLRVEAVRRPGDMPSVRRHARQHCRSCVNEGIFEESLTDGVILICSALIVVELIKPLE